MLPKGVALPYVPAPLLEKGWGTGTTPRPRLARAVVLVRTIQPRWPPTSIPICRTHRRSAMERVECCDPRAAPEPNMFLMLRCTVALRLHYVA